MNQLRQLQAGLRIGAARLSAHRTHAPLIRAFLSVWALTFPQNRAQSVPGWRDASTERLRASVLLEERDREDADLFARQLLKKKSKKRTQEK